MAIRLEAIASRLETIATRVEAIAIGFKVSWNFDRVHSRGKVDHDAKTAQCRYKNCIVSCHSGALVHKPDHGLGQAFGSQLTTKYCKFLKIPFLRAILKELELVSRNLHSPLPESLPLHPAARLHPHCLWRHKMTAGSACNMSNNQSHEQNEKGTQLIQLFGKALKSSPPRGKGHLPFLLRFQPSWL